jgi:hypothetical protein
MNSVIKAIKNMLQYSVLIAITQTITQTRDAPLPHVVTLLEGQRARKYEVGVQIQFLLINWNQLRMQIVHVN